MVHGYRPTVKVYDTVNMGVWSILDMLAYFEEKGAMRVSDMHIKVGAAPMYRIDGELVRIRGPLITEDIAQKLIFPLLTDENLEKLLEGSSE